MNLRQLLTEYLDKSFTSLGVENPSALVFATANEEFGDYQANGAMAIAKKLGRNPQSIAQEIVDREPLADLKANLDIGGPGFINIRLDDDFLATTLSQSTLSQPLECAETIVVDYSSPNIAKELHVGHLRSTVIGDALVRLFEFVGHRVIRQNHVGDWGTAFGKLIAYVNSDQDSSNLSIGGIEKLYVAASQEFDANLDFAQKARNEVIKLQQQDPVTLKTWEHIVRASLEDVQRIYSELDISLQLSDVRGESSYNSGLPSVVNDLENAGLIVESEGAKCVFVNGFQRKDGSPLPMIVQKSDGGYLYHTTDLAALKHRTQELDADRIIYLTDSRQIHHFQILFAVGRLVGYIPKEVSTEHLVFGSVLNKDGEPFRTRSGDNVLLRQLIEEGVERALDIVSSKSEHLTKDEQQQVARQVAVGAIKYADLSKNRTNDYRFDWEVMLSLDGNTAPYLQYAHARICSIFTRAKKDVSEFLEGEIELQHPSERSLALRLLRFAETLEQCLDERKPHYLCNYLYELTVHFMRFYENCPVLKAQTPKLMDSRLCLCAKTAQVLRVGLENLGISLPLRM
ncbi:MAG: arginine--tRNA ligase [Gammaproteobacteria bacterium]|nr:arginine--tRNA ligase [Gammaproteobacteria bacterium]MYF02637.1 arginine--tRNA ligase [Gammaproteobacteria bacterium]MYI76334.1 arginine--tRNA ligase [Gammaproteobacteria bacterium]